MSLSDSHTDNVLFIEDMVCLFCCDGNDHADQPGDRYHCILNRWIDKNVDLETNEVFCASLMFLFALPQIYLIFKNSTNFYWTSSYIKQRRTGHVHVETNFRINVIINVKQCCFLAWILIHPKAVCTWLSYPHLRADSSTASWGIPWRVATGHILR